MQNVNQTSYKGGMLACTYLAIFEREPGREHVLSMGPVVPRAAILPKILIVTAFGGVELK